MAACHHPDDPVINEVLNAFDGVFIFYDEVLVPAVADRLRQATIPVIVLGDDCSKHNLVSVRRLQPALEVAQLVEHLQDFGHEVIHCVNTQPHWPLIRQRMEHWRLWNATHGGRGTLIDEPVVSGQSPLPQARAVIQRQLAKGWGEATALLCISFPVAMAAIRVLHEQGYRVPEDISVCACDDGAGFGPHLVPSLTFIHDINPYIYLDACMDWIAHGGQWSGPLLLQQHRAELFKGESTGPCPKHS